MKIQEIEKRLLSIEAEILSKVKQYENLDNYFLFSPSYEEIILSEEYKDNQKLHSKLPNEIETLKDEKRLLEIERRFLVEKKEGFLTRILFSFVFPLLVALVTSLLV